MKQVLKEGDSNVHLQDVEETTEWEWELDSFPTVQIGIH